MRRTPSTAALALIALALLVFAPSAASAWAPAGQATIHPGVQTLTEGAQCTSNFVFTQGTDVYLGQAAHCSGTGSATDTDGCTSASLPVGTPVEIDGASRPGTLAYNSWITMQAKGETNADTCAYNDLALVKIDPADVAKVNPSVPGLRRPDGSRRSGRRIDCLHLRQLLSARRHHEAEPQAGRRLRDRGQRLEPHGVHREPGNPG